MYNSFEMRYSQRVWMKNNAHIKCMIYLLNVLAQNTCVKA